MNVHVEGDAKCGLDWTGLILIGVMLIPFTTKNDARSDFLFLYIILTHHGLPFSSYPPTLTPNVSL